MTVVLITGNLINQFKRLITTASLSAEQKGPRFDVDEFQKEMGEQKPTSQHSSTETRGVRPALGQSGVPRSQGRGLLRADCWLMQAQSGPPKLLESGPPLGPDSAQRPLFPLAG